MATMVDAFGPYACCEHCDEEVDESDLHTLENGDEVCGHCREMLRELAGIIYGAREG